jgi:poly(3-hydroxybutyrate) depolymerase
MKGGQMKTGLPGTGTKAPASLGHAIPAIVFHGDRDTTVSPINGNQVIAQSKAGAELRSTVSRGQAPGGISYTRTVASEDGGHPMLEHWVLHGAGHAWSGGSPSGSYTEPKGPDASREMMRFFLEHSKPAAASPS